jgi:ABC-type glutathione transport system ATPase component
MQLRGKLTREEIR